MIDLRNFGNITYISKPGAYRSKRAANKAADKIREKGGLARVAKVKGSYVIYIR